MFARVRSFWRGLTRPAQLEQDTDEEMRFHVDMETERLVNTRGLAPADARRQARLAFGGTQRYKAEGRDVRGLTRISDFSLDVTLAVRMLAKYPAVTIVGVLAMSIGIGLGAAYIEVVNDFLHPTLPLDEGERIVGLQNWDLAANKPELRVLSDFEIWRTELTRVENLGAFRSIERNVSPTDGPAEPSKGAEITPSAFQMTRVPALIGRPLIDAEARAGAPPVVVLGYQLWRTRFSADPGVVGRRISLGGAASTVVGVMPEGFAFPVNHQFWVPLHSNPVSAEPREGPPLQVFGRLAPGTSLSEAQAELTALGLRAANDRPATHERLRPRVVPYTELFVGGEGSGSEAYLLQFIFIILLIVLSSSVATMVFARTATRENEIAMRFALGSSRARLIAQFFVEALVLALTATVIGLAGVAWGTTWITRLIWELTGGQVPFWLDARVNVTTVLYAIGLAVLASAVAGVMPAFKATGPRVQARLRHSGGVHGSSLRFGGVWTGVIVVQVAFAVLLLPPAMVSISALAGADKADPGFAAEEYVSARIEMEADLHSSSEFQATSEELRRRLLTRPDVSGVTLASRLPGMVYPEPWIDVDGATGDRGQPDEPWVMPASVDEHFFAAFGARIVAGRGFTAADRSANPAVVLVNETFITQILGGRNAIGRRVRYNTRVGQQMATGQSPGDTRAAALEPGPWYEIIGVVSDLGMDTSREVFHSGTGAGIYHPLSPAAMVSGNSHSVRIAFHVRGGAEAFTTHLRQIAQGVHPSLRLYDIHSMDEPLDQATQAARLRSRFLTTIAACFAVIALLISAAGLYSVMSFTVWRHTREIGIRIALGASHRRIVTAVFSRAMMQIGVGLLVGALLWVYFIVVELKPPQDSDRVGLFVATSLALTLVGLVACGIPVIRALRIEPIEALRDP